MLVHVATVAFLWNTTTTKKTSIKLFSTRGKMWLFFSLFLVYILSLMFNSWCWLTDDFQFVGGVDLSCSVGDVTGVLPTVLRCQVLQTQGPPLLLSLPVSSCYRSTFLVHQRSAVLQPDDVRSRVTWCSALQTHWAAHGASNDPLPHLWWLGETWAYWKENKEKKTLRNLNRRSTFVSL